MSETIAAPRRRRRGKPFAPGRSGNPADRPQGARNKATLAAEVLLDGEAEGLIRLAVERARGGSDVALKLCLDRILGPRASAPCASRCRRWPDGPTSLRCCER